jgi:hypothetical protein
MSDHINGDRPQQFAAYQQTSRRISEGLESVRQNILDWIERNSGQHPPIKDIAILEAWHAERMRLSAELLEAEQRFMNYLVGHLRDVVSASSSDGRDGAQAC